MSGVRLKPREYVEWGVEHVWLIDPRNRIFYVCYGSGLRETPVLRALNAGIELRPSDIFE